MRGTTLWVAIALSAPAAARASSCFSSAQLVRADAEASACAACAVCAVSSVPNCDLLLHCRLPPATASAIASATSSATSSASFSGDDWADLARGQDATAVRNFWAAVTSAADQIVLTGGDLHANGLPNATLPAAAVPPASATAGLQTLAVRNVSIASAARLPALPNLQSLTLSGCALTGLSPLLPSPELVPNLRALNLATNALSAIPDAVYALRDLRTLRLEGNPILRTALTVSQYEFLSALEQLSADADAFQSDACGGQRAVVYFASNPLLSVCDPSTNPSAASDPSASASSSSSPSTSSSASSSDSQRPAIIAGSVGISSGLLVALVAKLLADRRRKRLKEDEQQARTRSGTTSSLGLMSPPRSPARNGSVPNCADGEWYHELRGDPSDGALPGVRTLLARCGLAAWHRDPAFVALEQPLGEFLAAQRDFEDSRTSTTIVSSSGLRTRWVARVADERVAARAVELTGDEWTDMGRLREFVQMAALTHPNVLQLRGVSYSSSLGLLVLVELMDRGDLRAYLRTSRPHADVFADGFADGREDGRDVDADEDEDEDEDEDARPTAWWGSRRLEIALDVARALEYLHSRGVAHGGLTSRVVLLDHEFAAKLGGLGRSRPLADEAADEVADADEDADGFLYQAPEVLVGGPAAVSAAGDVYAFGALLLELDRGRPPFRAAAQRRQWSDQELRTRLADVAADGTAAALMDASPACPAALRILAAACLSRDPGERPSSAALVAVLKSVLAAATEPEERTEAANKKRRKRTGGSRI